MISVKQKWLLAVVIGAGVLSAADDENANRKVELTDSLRSTLSRTQMGYQELERVANAAVVEGNRLFLEKKYFEARDKYLEAAKAFRNFSSKKFAQQAEYCRNQILKCYMAQADAAIASAEAEAGAKDFDAAIRICREAKEYCPEYKDRLDARIAFFEKKMSAANARFETSEERLLPEKKNQEYQIQLLLEQGRQFAAHEKYGQAVARFREVLLLDPFNDAALQNIEAMYTRMGKAGYERTKDVHRKMITEAEWEFALPYLPTVSTGGTDNMLKQGIAEGISKVKKNDRPLSELEQKLNTIIIKNIYFDKVPLSSAIKTLRDQSRALSPDGIGVNIIIRTPTEAEKQAALAAQGNMMGDGMMGPDGMGMTDPAMMPNNNRRRLNNNDPMMDDKGMGMGMQDEFGDEYGDEEEEEEEEVDEPTVSLLRSNVPLMTVLRDICEAIKWRTPKVDRFAVVLAPPEVALEDMESRVFPIDRDSLEQAVSGEGSIDDPNAIKNFFSKVGINFPIKSTILYDEKISRLVAHNTREELDKLELKIQELLEKRTPLVQVQVRFVEVSQNDLKELAFNYSLAVNANSDSHFKMQESGNNLLRYYDAANKGAKMSGENFGKDAQLTYSFSNDKGTSFMASLFALNWADSSDVLSSPRITTLPNQQAVIKMVEKHYYPDEWETVDTPEVTVADNDTVLGKVWYATKDPDPQPTFDDEPEDLGIQFTIEPEIVEDDLIKIAFNLPIKTFDGWDSYDPRSENTGTGSGNGNGGNGNNGGNGSDTGDDSSSESDNDDDEYFKKPRLNIRRIQTTALIRDGETVVLGGVTMDTTERLNDKIPILGDIPFIGRLFQSKYTKAEKRNLLVFVSCRLVKPDGTAYNPAKTRARGFIDGSGDIY